MKTLNSAYNKTPLLIDDPYVRCTVGRGPIWVQASTLHLKELQTSPKTDLKKIFWLNPRSILMAYSLVYVFENDRNTNTQDTGGCFSKELRISEIFDRS